MITNNSENLIKLFKVYNRYYYLFLYCVNKINFYNNYNKSIKCYFTCDDFVIIAFNKEKKEMYKLIINTDQKISYFVNDKLIFSFVDYLSKLLDDKEKLVMSLILNITTCEEHNQYKINDNIKNFIKFIIS